MKRSIIHSCSKYIIGTVNTGLNAGIPQLATCGLSIILVHRSDGLAQVTRGNQCLDVSITEEEIAAAEAMNTDGETSYFSLIRRLSKTNFGELAPLDCTIGVTAKESSARIFQLVEAQGVIEGGCVPHTCLKGHE